MDLQKKPKEEKYDLNKILHYPISMLESNYACHLFQLTDYYHGNTAAVSIIN